jgi:hypothetical protein
MPCPAQILGAILPIHHEDPIEALFLHRGVRRGGLRPAKMLGSMPPILNVLSS